MYVSYTNTTNYPDYESIVEKLLLSHHGDPSRLLNIYPNFDANGPRGNSESYLICACKSNHIDVVQGLLKCGAEVSSNNAELKIAERLNNIQMIRILLEHYTDDNEITK